MAFVSIDPSSIPPIVNATPMRLGQEATNKVLFASHLELRSSADGTTLVVRPTTETLSIDDASMPKGGARRFDIILLDAKLGEPAEWSTSNSAEIIGQALLSWKDSSDRSHRVVQLDVVATSDIRAPWERLLKQFAERAEHVGADRFVVSSESESIKRSCEQVGWQTTGYPFGDDIWFADLASI